MIIEIANKHRGERGLIHTTSFRNVDTLSNMLNMSDIADRMVYHTNQIDRNDLIDRMMSGKLTKDAIVVSPSMTRGADLKYDLCRFGIILKVPYGNTLDARVKVRSKDFRWYSMQALREVCQSYGRGTRAQDDFCTLYVLDAGFKKLINGVVKRNVPPWFRDAIVWDANI
jgi:Rad3-related DNA helicase